MVMAKTQENKPGYSSADLATPTKIPLAEQVTKSEGGKYSLSLVEGIQSQMTKGIRIRRHEELEPINSILTHRGLLFLGIPSVKWAIDA